MTDGALLLFNLVIKSYAEEAALLEAAANMMLYVINVLGSLHFFYIYIFITPGTSQPTTKKQAFCSIQVSS